MELKQSIRKKITKTNKTTLKTELKKPNKHFFFFTISKRSQVRGIRVFLRDGVSEGVWFGDMQCNGKIITHFWKSGVVLRETFYLSNSSSHLQ